MNNMPPKTYLAILKSGIYPAPKISNRKAIFYNIDFYNSRVKV